MRITPLFLSSVLIVLTLSKSLATTNEGVSDESKKQKLRERIASAKLDLWSRGAFALDERLMLPSCQNNDEDSVKCLEEEVRRLELHIALAPVKLGPVRKSRRDSVSCRKSDNGCIEFGCDSGKLWGSAGHVAMNVRGGSDETKGIDHHARLEKRLKELATEFGQEFKDAIELNKAEHASDCAESCKFFYCADPSSSGGIHLDRILNETSFASYSFGAVPPEDFADEFGFPLDLIKVSQGRPLFPAPEASSVISTAEAEGVDKNEYKSGKYKLGGDWLLNLPKTRAWFNERLETTFFPLLSYLFPEIVSSPAALRAHSVSLLKYNSSHPRTDIHIDNGILAMTLAMTPQSEYVGGGTFFEHMGVENVLPMDVGHGTFRPGSVRHGGHRVISGTRYILGAFLLLEDRVEHVRRLKNRGSELRRSGSLDAAEKHFRWAVAINPKCTTCLKDWAEVLLTRKQYALAETKIRTVLELLENQDSDALFTLGLLLSEQGRHDESIEAYRKSVALNSEDAELCYNLGIKLGERGNVKEEMAMYAKATSIDPNFGGAWINWGTTLAENGNLEDAEVMFMKAVECCPDVAPKGMMNLALVYQTRANKLASEGNLSGAKTAIQEASKQLDDAKPLLDQIIASDDKSNEGTEKYAAQFGPLRLQCHRLSGQIFAGMGDYKACEDEFRKATENFPGDPRAWDMFARILDLQGKADRAKHAKERASALRGFGVSGK